MQTIFSLLFFIFFLNCNSVSYKNSNYKDLPNWIFTDSKTQNISSDIFVNSNDHLKESEIIQYQKSSRVILVSTPNEMFRIYNLIGCLNGEKITEILNHTIDFKNSSDTWKANCSGGTLDQIKFKIFKFGDQVIYNQFHSIIEPIFAKSSQSISELKKVIEIEPADPEARFKLGWDYIQNKDCFQAMRNFRIFLRLFPKSPEKERIISTIQNKCLKN